ncbi:HigA family addiction module antidote protein [Pseudomonas chengduensis]|jgi:HTH-type transcriptional regulator/antitoxin HigA|nr:HigA family addiction module antitoxin [Pseudomonas chengduensis]MBG0845745.1 HigA family addiction module antidote protein [Pseudomonas chengduensis]
MSARKPAEVFAPGEFLRDELEARGWTQQELAEILDRPPRLVSEIISAKRAITPETAKGLGEAFGTSAEYWMNLESQYQLSKVKTESNIVARKAKLYTEFPVRETIRRGWIQASENIEVLEQRFLDFFKIKVIGETPSICHFAKRTNEGSEASMLQLAWLFRVKQLAEKQVLTRYSKESLQLAVEKLKTLLNAPEEARKAPAILAEAGVRIVFVEAISGSKIDGACFWLSEDKPVIGMTLRFDRIDNFWFVLRHEIEHILREDGKNSEGPIIDTNIGEDSSSVIECERLANQAAQNFCVPDQQLNDFIARIEPYFSEKKICAFAQRINIHPGLVVGQIQRHLGRHDFLRKHQVKIRDIVLSSAIADGWGIIPS